MSPLAFVGKLEASKSMMNRAILAQSFAPNLKINGESNCEDVRLMNEAVSSLASNQEIFAGSAGTVLRFMALRASRNPGKHVLRGEKRLFERPQEELIKILRQVGVTAKLGADYLEIEGDGWKLHGDTLLVPGDRSSQFASSVLLNAWGLPFDLYVSLGGLKVSEGYWRMSKLMAQKLGMRIDFWDGDFRVPRGQQVTATEIDMEIDMSSAFALAAVAAVSGRATLTDFPEHSLQPDAIFTDILERMGVPISLGPHGLKVEQAKQLNGVAVNLNSTPDLFPVLATLCALAHGESDLYGATQLVHKESDRLGRIAEGIANLGREVQTKSDGLKILGALPIQPGGPITWDTDQDHRLAFAGALLKAAGFPITILHPEVVDKSFPEFWNALGWKP